METVRFFERGRQGSEEWVEVKKLTAAEAFGEEGLGLALIGNVSRLLPGLLPDLTSRGELRDDGGKNPEPGVTNALTDGPDPSQVYVQSITYGGTGCPQGSVGSSISNDRKSFTLIFDSFVASSGMGVPALMSGHISSPRQGRSKIAQQFIAGNLSRYRISPGGAAELP